MFFIYRETLLLISIWVFMWVIITGIGLFLSTLFRSVSSQHYNVLFAFWVGFAAVLGALQIWHLFFPVNVIPALVVPIVGVWGWWRARPKIHLTMHENWFPLAVGLAFILLFASRAANAEGFTDDGLYHIQEMRWAQSSPLVIGLGNFHGRFGFNNALALFAAGIDNVFPIPGAIRIMNGLFLFAFLLIGLRGLPTLKKDTFGSGILAVLFLVPLLANAHYASTLKNDLIVALLGLILLLRILTYIESTRLPNADPNRQLFFFECILLACASVCIKLSASVYSAGMLLLALVMVMDGNLYWRKALNILLVSVMTFLGVWMLRSILLSGYAFFPVTAFHLPVDWRIPLEIADAERAIISNWARYAGADYAQVIAEGRWFLLWWQGLQTMQILFIGPILLALITSGAIVVYSFQQRMNVAQTLKTFRMIVPSLAALGVWFVTAPDVRFAWGYAWALAGTLLFIAIPYDKARTRRWIYALRPLALGIALLLGFDVLVRGGEIRFLPYELSRTFAASPTVTVQSLITFHGARVDVPEAGDGLCWDASLPCAPAYNPFLRYQHPNEVRAGFALEPVQTDKGVYGLVAFNELLDITPETSTAVLHTANTPFGGHLPVDGLLLGSEGWGALEMAGEERWRWLANEATLYITEISREVYTLIIEVEPGPSLGSSPLTLTLTNEESVFAGSIVAPELGNYRVEMVSNGERVQILRLHIESPNLPAPNDGRILNARILSLSVE